jgi:hypothetical protein
MDLYCVNIEFDSGLGRVDQTARARNVGTKVALHNPILPQGKAGAGLPKNTLTMLR